MARHEQLIKRFWKPDGISADAGNETALKKWMRANALSIQPGSITTLLYSPVHRSARAALVRELPLSGAVGHKGGSAK